MAETIFTNIITHPIGPTPRPANSPSHDIPTRLNTSSVDLIKLSSEQSAPKKFQTVEDVNRARTPTRRTALQDLLRMPVTFARNAWSTLSALPDMIRAVLGKNNPINSAPTSPTLTSSARSNSATPSSARPSAAQSNSATPGSAQSSYVPSIPAQSSANTASSSYTSLPKPPARQSFESFVPRTSFATTRSGSFNAGNPVSQGAVAVRNSQLSIPITIGLATRPLLSRFPISNQDSSTARATTTVTRVASTQANYSSPTPISRTPPNTNNGGRVANATQINSPTSKPEFTKAAS